MACFERSLPPGLPQACNYFFILFIMVEPLLSGIVLGLVPVTLAGLFVTAYLQYRRGDRVTSSF